MNTAVPRTYEMHADKANSDTIKLGPDPGLLEFDELLPGQSQVFENFIGAIWALAASGTLNLRVVWVQYAGQVRK